MKYEQTTEGMDEARSDFERQALAEEKKYTPRPRWQIVAAWVLLAVVILGVINIVYMQMSA